MTGTSSLSLKWWTITKQSVVIVSNIQFVLTCLPISHLKVDLSDDASAWLIDSTSPDMAKKFIKLLTTAQQTSWNGEISILNGLWMIVVHLFFDSLVFNRIYMYFMAAVSSFIDFCSSILWQKEMTALGFAEKLGYRCRGKFVGKVSRTCTTTQI